jgi:hypothetical protein
MNAAPVQRLGRRARILLRASIVAAWIVGVGGSASSCLTLKYYQSPRPSEGAMTAGPPDAPAQRMLQTWIALLDRYRARRVPLAIADLLLSLALLVGAARTLARRPGGKSWLRQVCFATAVFALVEIAVRRAEYVDAVDRYAQLASEDAGRLRVRFEAALGAYVAAQLALFGGLAWALGKPSVVLELAPEPSDRSIPPPSGDDEGGG